MPPHSACVLVPVQVQSLREFLVPLLRKVMSSLTQETLHDWAQLASEVSVSKTHCHTYHSCAVSTVVTISSSRGSTFFFGHVQADRDPHRIHWVLELMAEEPLKGTDGSFQDARLAEVWHVCIVQCPIWLTEEQTGLSVLTMNVYTCTCQGSGAVGLCLLSRPDFVVLVLLLVDR